MGVIQKVTVLGFFAAFSVAIANIIFCIMYMAVDETADIIIEFDLRHWFIWNAALVLGVFIELFSIYLSSGFSKKMYYSLCSSCNRVCFVCWYKTQSQYSADDITVSRAPSSFASV